MLSRRICFTSVILASLVSATALADQKRFGANDCVMMYDDELYSNHWEWDRGEMRIGTLNPWPQFVPMYISCPLVRSNTTSTTGLSSIRVKLHKERGASFTCIAKAFDMSGSAIKTVSKGTTTVGDPEVIFENLDAVNRSQSRGTYGVSCGVNGKVEGDEWGDEVVSITYNEN